MTWRAIVAALDDGDSFQSRISMYLHPLCGRPVAWHVLQALAETNPPPSVIQLLHSAGASLAVPEVDVGVEAVPVSGGEQARAVRAAVTTPGPALLVNAGAALLTAATLARLRRAGEQGVALLAGGSEGLAGVAVAGEGPALASAEDPFRPTGATRVAATVPQELLLVRDRHSLAAAGVALRDRLVRQHEAAGVSFILPESVWLDVDVRIGADTVVYPGAVLEGATEIGEECVIGPQSHVVESTIGRGVELRGWNYVVRTSIRNHAVLEAHVRRGFD